MGEYKMGIISKTVIIGVSAGAGYSACYFLREEVRQVPPVDCRVVYEQGLSAFQESSKDIKPMDRLATPADFQLDYIVSKEQKFKGFVFTDAKSSKQGVITKQDILGKPIYGFAYVDFGSDLKSAQTYTIQPEILASGIPSVAPASSPESIPSLLEKKIRKELAE